MNEKIPNLFTRKETCCGCSACLAACPMGAIRMVADQEGFDYPKIDADKCIGCLKCISVCAFKRDQREKGFLSSEE